MRPENERCCDAEQADEALGEPSRDSLKKDTLPWYGMEESFR